MVLEQLLDDEDETVRATAARCIGNFAQEAKLVIPALERALRDSAAPVRVQAAETLVHLGADREAVVPVLIESR